MKLLRDIETPEQVQARKDKDRDHKKLEKKRETADTRLKIFTDRLRWGPSYACITCHQTLFKHQVIELKPKLRDELKNIVQNH